MKQELRLGNIAWQCTTCAMGCRIPMSGEGGWAVVSRGDVMAPGSAFSTSKNMQNKRCRGAMNGRR